MAIENYIGWPTNVNRVILDSTTIKLGDNALKVDELENGHKRSRQRSAISTEEYSVVMDFDWVNKVGSTNKTELELFYDWFKYKHKCGSVPFEFPKILLSPVTGIRVYDEVSGNYAVEYYKITSAVEGKKSGQCVEVNMTWQSVYGGVISIQTPTPSIQTLEAANGYADIIFSEVSDTAPTSTMITLYVDDTQTEIKGFMFDGYYRARVYFDKVSSGNHTVSFEMSYSGLVVEKDDVTATFTV